jgi:hypothetical protein
MEITGMEILGIIGFLVVIFIVRVATRKRGWRINEYEEDGKPYYRIATDTLLFPFWYHEDGMQFKWCGEIDFDLAYGLDEGNKFSSKELALARINKWRSKEAGDTVVRSYKIVDDAYEE